MFRLLGSILLLGLVACVPATPSQSLPRDCLAEAATPELLSANWLAQSGAWRLRQSALLQIGTRKFAMEGFLRLDPERNEARLLAMNEMGLVLFDLLVNADGQQLKRSIPQLQDIEGFAVGVAQSLRQIFLRPRPLNSDHRQDRGNTQRLWRALPGGSLGFIYDCRGDMRETRLVADSGDWRVAYDQYRVYGKERIPGQIVLNDYLHGVKLSLWIHEVNQEP